MKSSLGKLGRKLSMNSRIDGKDKKDHQHLSTAHFEELAQASKDVEDLRNCYDSLLSAAAATANSIFEFSESLSEMGTCLLYKTTADTDDESGIVLSALGNMQADLHKIADTYRSYIILTVTNPTESLLAELRKVEEMKLQCDEKREKGNLRSGKVESSVSQKPQEAQDEYDEAARLYVFRVKSLKEGQGRSLLAQAARHHAAQLNFFRKGLKAVEAIDAQIRIAAEKHHIDYQLSGLNDDAAGKVEAVSSYESIDNGELSFDQRENIHGLDKVATSSNLTEIDVSKYQGEQHFGRQAWVSSYSAPLYPEKTDPSRKPKVVQPPGKIFSYVLPPPVVDTKPPVSRTPTSASLINPSQKPLPDEKHDRNINDTSTSTSAAKPPLVEKDVNVHRLSFPRQDSHGAFDGKSVKRQAYSGPLPPSKSFSGKMSMASTSGRSDHQQMISRVPVSHSVSPPSLTSPKINELHELPRPPIRGLGFSRSVTSSSGLIGPSAPLFFKNQETSIPNKVPILTSTSASPLPPPPLVVPRSFSTPSRNQRAISLDVAKLMESPQPGPAASPPLAPISLANFKLLSTASEVASDMTHI
uniref:uncharacterized protein At2g33490-like isoform X2 n=1 Tax=Erigeron canadensis TaxID=72917 RepID=UPI001CB97405|nr:uncharacterized protein At2g33490-like isoform X2 [Erigeron canadensis]